MTNIKTEFEQAFKKQWKLAPIYIDLWTAAWGFRKAAVKYAHLDSEDLIKLADELEGKRK